MKIVQTVFGKFHHFHLARQLYKKDMLESIFTSYPMWKLSSEGIPKNKIRSFPWLHTFLMAKWRYGIINEKLDKELSWILCESFDQYVAKRIPPCDVFVGISASGLHTGALVKRKGIKYICDRCSSHIKYANSILHEEYSRWGMKYAGIDPRLIDKEEKEYQQADVITVPSEFARNSFIGMGIDLKKIVKIPYGVDLDMFSQVCKPPNETFEVLFIGQVSLRKGIPYLLDGFSKFHHFKKRLRIVGSIFPNMGNIFKDHDMKNVELLGPVPHNKLKEIISNSHVMVLPSIEDGFGYVLGQAMACGCPLVSTTNTGGPDLFTDGKEGFIIPIRNSEAITEKLEIIAQNPKMREEMSFAAIDRVKYLGGWDTYGEQFSRLCKEIIA